MVNREVKRQTAKGAPGLCLSHQSRNLTPLAVIAALRSRGSITPLGILTFGALGGSLNKDTAIRAGLNRPHRRHRLSQNRK